MRIKIANTNSEDRDQIEFGVDSTGMTVSLVDNSAGGVVVTLGVNGTVMQRTNSILVHQSGHSAADIPVGTVVSKFDAYGNFILGNNKLLSRTTGNLLANGIVPTGLMYQQESHYLYVGGGLGLATVGDPADFQFARFGPDNTWPDNGGLGVAGIPSGTSLGEINWFGAATPSGGTPDVTLGAFLQSKSAMIFARASENNLNNGDGTYNQGGELIFGTTPNGTSTARERLAIRNGGIVDVLTGGTLNLADAVNVTLGTTTGTKIGTVGGAAGQKLGFYNATPVVQPLLATGATHTVDDVITVLQTLGLARQS